MFVSANLPPPVSAAVLAAAEAEPDFVIPAPLLRLYADIADGGFGPGGGLLALADLLAHGGICALTRPCGAAKSGPPICSRLPVPSQGMAVLMSALATSSSGTREHWPMVRPSGSGSGP
ncbi:MAG: hypothetical protein EXR09_06725 [Acetobacteraceae bacterium]|nr:hypothetical protein [Acetobacteraceae bacterium]